jgi:predicted translin family RNA/ssDNA-binding protein
MATNYGALQFWVGHFEKQLPRRENYRKKSVAHLEKLEKKLTRCVELLRDALTRHPDDETARAMMEMYQYHKDAALLALAAKTGEMKTA